VDTIPVSRFKATCLAVLQRVRRTRRPVLITRFGRPVAEVIPPPAADSRPGVARRHGRAGEDHRRRRGTRHGGARLGGDQPLKLLLDTHVWLWSLAEPAMLSRRVRLAITRPQNEVWLSPISVWELLVLAERGRLKLDEEPRRWVMQALARTPANEAVLTFEVAARSREIVRAHPDPADRFLVATAIVYRLTLVTADESLIGQKVCAVLPCR
jgi:PIN domain nuclease of toxin-antitoxin system/antitoxin (DNA-binding transcriptional repressor) of toxin-antitoxin stability system